MALTRANVEAILIKRIGALFTACGLDGTTVAGTNVDLNDPIGYGIRYIGGSTSAPNLITDTDVATVTTADYDEFFDVVEFRCLQTAMNNLTKVNITVGPRREEYGQLATRLETMIQRKQKELEETYGYHIGTIEAGNISLDFAEHDEDYTDELGY